ncbi:MAG: (Fe-S)-binding protein [Candidatus Odinarchaeota archaeon]
MNKLIFLGCLSSSRYRKTCENAIKIIKLLDNKYQVLKNPPCCGSLAHQIVPHEEIRDHVNFVNDWFNNNGVTKLITICAGCYNYLTRYYSEYLGTDFNVKVMHLLQFINKPENLEKLNLKYSGKKLKIYYHDACHLRNAKIPIIDEPRNIINSIEGNIVLGEMENNRVNSLCCGAGGGAYSIFKENSDFSSKLIFDQMKMSKALLTACPFCYTSFIRIKEENNIKTPVIKFEDFILKLIEGVDPISV